MDPPDPLPARPLSVLLVPPHGGDPVPAKLRLTRPGPGCVDWVIAVRLGEQAHQSNVYLLSPSALRSFLRLALGTPGGKGVVLSVGELTLNVPGDQWPRVQDYLSMFEEAAR